MRAAILIVVLSIQAAAPPATYTVTKWTGDHDFLFEFRGAAAAVMVPPANDVLSARQKLPFPWKFFGQPVDGYSVSDNGYITFDPAAKASVARNTGLPDASAPANSIFAFWNDFRMEDGHGQWVGHVYTATLGAAPNRVHVIYWMGPIAAPDSFATSSYNFLLALHENGEFEITFASGRKGVPLKATIGAVAADGKTAVLAEGPNFDYPAVGYGGADDLNYKFKPVVK